MPSKRSKPAPAPTEDPLFQLDSLGSTSIRNDLLHGPLAPRQRKGVKPLRSDQILAERLKVGAPALNGRQTKGKGKQRLLSAKERKRLEGLVGRKDKRKAGTLATATDPEASVSKGKLPTAPTSDIWSSAEPIPSTSGEKEKTVKAPVSLRRHEELSLLAKVPEAIQAPNHGMSYNPTLGDHQAVLREALAKAENEEEKERIARELKARMDASTKRKTREGWQLYEDEVGSGESGDEVEAEEGDGAADEVKRRKVQKKKTVQKRKRQLKAAAEAQLHADRIRRKATSRSLAELPSLVTDITAHRSASASKHLRSTSRRLSALSKHGLLHRRPPTQPFQLTEELSEAGLRGLKPEGSLWREWQVGARRRGMMEVQVGQEGKGQKGRAIGKGAKYRSRREVEKHAWKNFS